MDFIVAFRVGWGNRRIFGYVPRETQNPKMVFPRGKYVRAFVASIRLWLSFGFASDGRINFVFLRNRKTVDSLAKSG